MSAKATIVTEINTHTGRFFLSMWRIGLTHDPVEGEKYWRETKKQRTGLWKQWQADSLSEAQDIEAAFIAQGMKSGTGGDLSPSRTAYVYVF
jgi:hypothetical protein